MILVDAIQSYETPLRFKMWCHMVSTVDEADLHAFAARIGMKRSWAQLRPKASAAHYDLVPRRREHALRLGAVQVGSRMLVLANYDGLRRRGMLDLHPSQRADLIAFGIEVP